MILLVRPEGDTDPYDVSWMVGRRVDVSVTEPGHVWSFGLGDPAFISVECLWRLLVKGKTRLTSQDHNQQYGLPAPIDAAAEANKLLMGCSIVSAALRRGTADLVIDLEGDVRLEVIPDATGYEAWQFSTPEGRHVIAVGGGTLSTW